MWVVWETVGRTPMGGGRPCTIMAVDPLPQILQNMPPTYPGEFSPSSRTRTQEKRALGDGEVCKMGTWKEDLANSVNGQLAFLLHNILTPREANAFIEVSERCGYSDAAPGIQTPPGMRMNLASFWMPPQEWMQTLFERCRLALPQEIDGKKLLGFSSRVNMYKYLENMHFKPHIDGDWPAYGLDEVGKDRIVVLDRRRYGHSKLSMLLYLNDASRATAYDDVRGGSTTLYESRDGGRAFDVAPQKGSALFFRHGFGPDSVLHAGSPVRGQSAKYVARINVLYEVDEEEESEDDR